MTSVEIGTIRKDWIETVIKISAVVQRLTTRRQHSIPWFTFACTMVEGPSRKLAVNHSTLAVCALGERPTTPSVGTIGEPRTIYLSETGISYNSNQREKEAQHLENYEADLTIVILKYSTIQKSQHYSLK